MNVLRFFDNYVEYLRERSETVKYLAVSAASEAWFAAEAAALMNRRRNEIGVAGLSDTSSACNAPRRLIILERGKVDLSIIDIEQKEKDYAFEFKLLHNNKNYRSKIAELKRDVARGVGLQRDSWGVAICFHLIFDEKHRGNYQPIGGFKSPVTAEAMTETWAEAMAVPSQDEHPALEWAVTPQLICTLDDANYIAPDNGASVSVGLVRQARRATERAH